MQMVMFLSHVQFNINHILSLFKASKKIHLITIHISNLLFLLTIQKLHILKKNAFAYSTIELLFIPKSLIDLKEGWCYETSKLVNIRIMDIQIYNANL